MIVCVCAVLTYTLVTTVWCSCFRMNAKALQAFESIISMKITVNRLRIFQKRNKSTTQKTSWATSSLLRSLTDAKTVSTRPLLCVSFWLAYVSCGTSHCYHRARKRFRVHHSRVKHEHHSHIPYSYFSIRYITPSRLYSSDHFGVAHSRALCVPAWIFEKWVQNVLIDCGCFNMIFACFHASFNSRIFFAFEFRYVRHIVIIPPPQLPIQVKHTSNCFLRSWQCILYP